MEKPDDERGLSESRERRQKYEQPKRSYPFSEDAGFSGNKKHKSNPTYQSTSKTKGKTSNTSTKMYKNVALDDTSAEKKKNDTSLLELLRPASLESYVGQKHLLGPKTILGRLLRNGKVTSMILWGPPGCGKSSLANVIAESAKSTGEIRFVKLSAATSGIADITEIASRASLESKLHCRTILFIDQIHRFNKAQQDIFLPHVEAGTIILIGATTENPSFSLNSALLSRCRVYTMERLTRDEIATILERGIFSCNGLLRKCNTFANKDIKTSVNNSIVSDPKFLIDEEVAQWLVDSSNGDAKDALNRLEMAVRAKIPHEQCSVDGKRIVQLTKEDLVAPQERSYDSSDDHKKYDLVSAMQKSVQAGDANATFYWLARLMASEKDPIFIAKCLVKIAGEDVGLADPNAFDMAVNTMHACQMIGMPECDVILGQCALYMAQTSEARVKNHRTVKSAKNK